MYDYINRQRELTQMALHGSPHSSPDPVAHHSASQHLADCKSHAWTRAVIPLAAENHYVPRKMFSAFLVYDLKICMFQQS